MYIDLYTHISLCFQGLFNDSSLSPPKVYEPEWLAGTCVGELLFQADYHLKEPDGEMKFGRECINRCHTQSRYMLAGNQTFSSRAEPQELSMGEYDQPIVGMRSCLELSDMEGYDKDWSAREWFVIRKAEIYDMI